MKQVMVLTGGSRGIGAAIARMAGQRGYAVAFNYRSNAAAAEAVCADIEAAGGQALALRGDAASEQDMIALFDASQARFGPPTAFVNNAGITGKASRLDEADADKLREVIDVNVTGMLLGAREAVRRMSTRHGGAGGCIINMGSAAATLGGAGEFTWYAASKGAVNTLTTGLALEVAKEGIRVNAVAPGLIETDIHESAGVPGRVERIIPNIPMGRIGSAEEVAEAVLWLLSDAAGYITGEVLRIAGGR